MFSREDVEYFKRNISGYIIYQFNYHDVTIHSTVTGHDWIIISSYSWPNCYILHRHSGRDPYHRQRGRYKSLRDAQEYIIQHDTWFCENKMKKKEEQGCGPVTEDFGTDLQPLFCF